MSLVTTFAGIGWDPEIRGILTVVVGVAVLMGSVYLLLSTNVAGRLGFLLSLAAVFGWLTIHGITWWIYPPGNGPHGDLPSWHIEEINHGDLSQAQLEKAHDLDTSELPAPEDLRELSPEQVEQLNEDEADLLNEWEFLPEGNAARGEAQTTIDAALATGIVGGIADTTDYIYLYAFDTGGKPQRQSDGVFDRVANKVTNTLRITSPPHYAVVQLQPTIDQEAVPGEPPPTPEANESASVISVVLVRDLGERRLPAALVTVGAGSTFGLLCMMLHQRDRRVKEHREAPLPVTTSTE
jgi:hypothetical protein